MAIRHNTPRLVGLGALAAALLGSSGLRAAHVAHEGFPNAAAVTSLLQQNGHTAMALNAAAVEAGALDDGAFDVLVIGRMTVSNGASLTYVNRVATFVANGGHIVSELSGAAMFFSSYGADVLGRVRNTRQLGLFNGVVHGGFFNTQNSAIDVQQPSHPVVAGLANPFADGLGTEIFFWLETADPNLQVVGTFQATSMMFPAGDLPCLLVGESGASRFVFASWDWADSLALSGANRMLFLNAIGHVAAPPNQPPSCGFAGAYEVECQGPVAMFDLDASDASDAEGDALSFAWSADCAQASFDDPSSPTPVLTLDTSGGCALACTVTVTVSDGQAQTACSAGFSVVDTTPPQVSAALEAQATDGELIVRFSAVDLCGVAAPQATLTVGGMVLSVQDGERVQVDCASVASSPAADPSGGAALDPGSAGENEVRLDVTAADGCGNSAGASASLVLGVDLCKPAPPPPPEEGADFVRGDANGNEHVGLCDVARILRHVCGKGEEPLCRDALDVNDDGRISLHDAVALTRHLFGRGPAMAPPFPEPGQDPTVDELDCEVYPHPDLEQSRHNKRHPHRHQLVKRHHKAHGRR